MQTIVIIIAVLVLFLSLRYFLILCIFPFQVIYNRIRKRWNREEMPIYAKLLELPYRIWEHFFHNGWNRYMLYQVSLWPSCHLRRFIYGLLGAQIGKNVVFHFRTEIRNVNGLVLGDGCIIGDNALLDARNGLIFGKNVNLSSNVSIYTEQHDHRDPNFGLVQKSVIVGDRVWLGCNVVILPGVNIGEGAVCCAGCVVTKDVEPYSVIAGIPAKKIGERNRSLTYEFDGVSCRLY